MKLLMFAIIIIMMALVLGAGMMTRDGEDDSYLIRNGKVKWQDLGAGLAAGLFVTLAIKFGPTMNSLGLVVILLLAAIGAMVALFAWLNSDTMGISEWNELVPFALMFLTFSLTAGIFTTRIAELVQAGKFGLKVLGALPWMLLVGFIGASIFAVFDFKEKHTEVEARRKKLSGGKIAAAVVTLLALILLPACGQQTEQQPEPEPTKAAEPQVTAPAPAKVTAPEWVWHHDGVIEDNYDQFGNELTGDALKLAKENDFDFGLDPAMQIMLEKIEAGTLDPQPLRDIAEKKLKNKDFTLEDIANKSVNEIYMRLVSAEEVYQKVGAEKFNEMVSPQEAALWLKDAMREDPAFAAAVMAGYDVTMHTDFLGDYMVNYEGQEEPWMRLINGTAKMWSEDPDKFKEDLDKFFVYLDHMDPSWVRVDSGIKDQMYMLGLIPGEMPEVIVMETIQEHGLFLVFTENVKSNVKQFALRDNCGFQLSNVGKLFGVTPRQNPNKPASNSGKGSGGPENSGKGSGGPAITNPKDPTKGTPVGPNDTPGPGPNTNNPADPQHSILDMPTNSGFMTLPEYRDAMDELEDANKNTRVAGDPNTPSTSAPPDTTVHSNADNGYGWGGIDDTTPISNPVSGTELNRAGNETLVKESVAGEVGQQWGGPPD